MPMVAPINPEESGKCRELLALLRDEENHVGGGSQLRHLQRHRNDHAQNGATDHDGRSDFARAGRRQLAFEPADPIRITRVRAGLAERFEKCRAHGIISAADL